LLEFIEDEVLNGRTDASLKLEVLRARNQRKLGSHGIAGCRLLGIIKEAVQQQQIRAPIVLLPQRERTACGITGRRLAGNRLDLTV
jgi:hypothetical protein